MDSDVANDPSLPEMQPLAHRDQLARGGTERSLAAHTSIVSIFLENCSDQPEQVLIAGRCWRKMGGENRQGSCDFIHSGPKFNA
jgi:hypothetical protein